MEVTEEDDDCITLRVSSGLGLSDLVRRTFSLGSGALWKFAGIPGTVGGAVFGNVHGKDRLFGDFVIGGRIWRQGQVCDVERGFFGFGYDDSALKESGDVLLEVTLRMPRSGNLPYQRFLGERWFLEKSRKFPHWPSAGCIFKNLTREDQRRLGLPTSSTGYFIDQVLGLSGRQIGGAEVSTEHANFIVNRGGAQARDVWEVLQVVEAAARRYGVELQREIRLVGEFG